MKINWCPVLHGGQGVGKDLMLEPLKIGVGRKNVSEVKPKTLENAFNASWIQKQLIVLQEFASFGRVDAYNELKNLITAPPESVTVTEKYKTSYDIPNVQNYIAMTNHDDAIRAEVDDRRFWVYSTEAQKRDDSYYGVLADWMRTGGNEKVIRWLMDRTIGSGFSAARPPADTLGHKTQMALAALPKQVQWVLDQFDKNGLFEGRELVTLAEIQRRADLARVQGMGEWAAREALKVLGGRKAAKGAQVRMTDGSKLRLWATSKDAAQKYANELASTVREGYEAGSVGSDL